VKRTALVVGYGRMGGFHAKTLRDLGYEVVTVDPDPAVEADFFTLDTVIAPFPATWVRGDTFDVAVVACPPEHLLDTAYRLAGLPMLVEKPFAMSLRDAHLLDAYLARFEQPVAVGLVERFNPQVRALRGLLETFALGKITGVTFRRHNPRPSWDEGLDLRLHDVDLALWLRLLSMNGCSVAFDTVADTDERVRVIEVRAERGHYRFDLMEHDQHPLTFLWHAFLSGGEYPKPEDAIKALSVLPATYAAEKEEMAA